MDARVLIVLLLLTVSAVPAASDLPIHDDAGTGQDAGDDPSNATVLPAGGTYNGTLLPAGDTDWYEVPTPGDAAVCYQASIRGEALASGKLALAEALDPVVVRDTKPGYVLDLGLAGPNPGQVLFGLAPVGELDAADSAGAYIFTLEALGAEDLGPGDGGSGHDAGEEPGEAVVTDGPCLAGTFENGKDERDRYSFDGVEGESVALSLAPTALVPMRLSLVSPSGQTETEIRYGGFTDVTLDETGSWVLDVELLDYRGDDAPTQPAYLVGLTINGPDPPPCKPSCMVG